MRRAAAVLPLVLTFALSLMAAYALPEAVWAFIHPSSADTDSTFFLAGFIGLAVVFLALQIWGAVWLLRGETGTD